MLFGVGDGSAHAAPTRAVEMQMISKLRSTLSVLEKYCSSRIEAAFQHPDPPWRDFELGSQENRKVKRVVPNALSWVRCHRLGDKPI